MAVQAINPSPETGEKDSHFPDGHPLRATNIAIWSITIRLFDIAMQNGPFIDDFPSKSSICNAFSMAILSN